MLVDHYDDDWTQLWWVRLDGVAEVVVDGAEHEYAIALLEAKYPQYRAMRPSGAVREGHAVGMDGLGGGRARNLSRRRERDQ